MGYFNENYMNHRREQWLRSIHAVEVLAGQTWYRGVINQKKIEGDTLVIMATFPELDSVTCTIGASRIIDIRGEQAAYQQRTINKIAGEGCMLKVTVPIYEVTV